MFRHLADWLRDTSSGPSREARELITDTEGAIFVEYMTLTLMVTVLCAAATLTLGDPLMRLFRFQQAVILTPIP
jgi:hypothetical protein